MKADEFNEWDYSPLNLNAKEIEDPISVIYKFFDDDDLPGHLGRLKDWSYCLVTDVYYKGNKESPTSLLYFNKLVMSLIEAAHLLKDRIDHPNVSISANDLNEEQVSWKYYPLNLSLEQQLNPYPVFDKFFEAYDLAQYRWHLSEWLEYGLSNYAANEAIKHGDLLRIMENLQLLFAACWLIFQRTTERPRLKESTKSDIIINLNDNVEIGKPPRASNIYNLDWELNRDQTLLFQNLSSKISHKVDSVEAILYLGKTPANKLFLLVLTSNEETRTANSLAATIEESCHDIADIVALVHFKSALFIGLEKRNVFFQSVLAFPAVYLSGELLLPTAVSTATLNNEQKEFRWAHWHKQGLDFLTGAEFYCSQRSYNAALFNLHQCTECILTAIIRGVTGYHTNNHNLLRLLRLSQMFTQSLYDVFDLENKDSKLLFDELKNAYSNVRYKDDYEINAELVKLLLPKVKSLFEVTEEMYKRYLTENTL